MTKYISVDQLIEDDLLHVNSSATDVENFSNGALHGDYQRWIKLELETLRSLIDDEDMKYTGRDYDKFRGGIKAFKQMLVFFPELAQSIMEINDNPKEENV